MDFISARNIIKTNIANRLNKSVEDLIPWTDYDPITVDESAYSIMRQSQGICSNWSGD
jgi:hypothetical protein